MIHLTRSFLQDCEVDAIGYGAKDTGEMGGGAASSVIRYAGIDIQKALKIQLANSTRQVGEVVATDAFSLQDRGIKWVLHIISIIKNTPQGAYCPQPEKIENGIYKALTLTKSLGAKSVAFSALGTGEGRVSSKYAAELMLRATQRFLKKEHLEVYFALPNYEDYKAFQQRLAGQL